MKSFLGKEINKEKLVENNDRRGRFILKYSTNNKRHLGKQVKCSAKNYLGPAVGYKDIPGKLFYL
jgi:hypothetical protein